MVRFSEDAEVAEKIEYEIVDTTDAVKGNKMCDNFMFFGKTATKSLGLFTGLGLADGVNFPEEDYEPDDILGKYLYIDTEKDKDSGYLKCPFNVKKYREYKSTKTASKPKPVKKDIDEEIPF